MDGEQSHRSGGHMRDTPELSGGPEKETPSQLGETILRELVSSASGSTVKAVLAPVLRHCDNHSLWEEKCQVVLYRIWFGVVVVILVEEVWTWLQIQFVYWLVSTQVQVIGERFTLKLSKLGLKIPRFRACVSLILQLWGLVCWLLVLNLLWSGFDFFWQELTYYPILL